MELDDILDIVESELKDQGIDLRAKPGELRAAMAAIVNEYTPQLQVQVGTLVNPIASAESKETARFNRDMIIGQMKADVASLALGEIYATRTMVATVFSTALRIAVSAAVGLA